MVGGIEVRCEWLLAVAADTVLAPIVCAKSATCHRLWSISNKPSNSVKEGSIYSPLKRHDGSLPLVGVNTFLPKDQFGEIPTTINLIHSTEGKKDAQIANVRTFQCSRNELAESKLPALQNNARERQNISAALMYTVKTYSLAQTTHYLHDVGGGSRRNV